MSNDFINVHPTFGQKLITVKWVIFAWGLSFAIFAMLLEREFNTPRIIARLYSQTVNP